MTFSTAASLPTSLWHAYHALIDLARLEKGETVLIHDADNCVGQIAIQIAKRIGAIILISAFSERERADPSDYCGIPDIVLLPSTIAGLSHAIYRETHGKGVDVMIGAFASSSIPDLAGCLKPCGRLINLHVDNGETLGTSSLALKGLSISSVDLLGALRANPSKVYRSFQRAFMLAVEWDIEPPNELHVFDAADYKYAFTHLLQTEISGKRMIELRENSVIPVSRYSSMLCVSD
jgi:NADPH:quinone reductase-like Zn-dependent oxidoreductase